MTLRALILAIVVALMPGLVFAVSEDALPYKQKDILQYYREHLEFGTFAGKDGIIIAYAKHEIDHEKGALVISSGRTEFIKKYAELIYDFRDFGYSLYIMDHRGQGYSGRLLKNHQKSHVDAFEDYIDDLKKFMDLVVNQRVHDKRFILTHSMGGTTAVLYAIRYPNEFNGLILCAPMMQLNTGLLPAGMASFHAQAMVFLGMGNAYVFGQGIYDPHKPFPNNNLTHSSIRYAITRNYMIEDPDLAHGWITNRWLREALRGCRLIQDRAAEVKIPLLLLQAGKDTVVKAAGQDKFCEKAANCRKVVLEGAYHEILMEEDTIRNKALHHVREFLAHECSGNN